MNFVINDLAFSCQSQTAYDCIQNIKTLIIIIKELKNLDILTRLNSGMKFRGIQLAPNYFFEQLLNDERLTKEERIFLKTVLVNSSKVPTSGNITFEIEGELSEILAYAYFNNAFVLSIRTALMYCDSFIHGYLRNNEEIFKADIPNISKLEDIEVHKFRLGIRVYENNPKHKINYGWGSPMDLDDETAQMVLSSSIPVPNNINHLINFYENKYYSFRRHHQNCFHGYIDEGLPENLKRLLDV